MTTLLAIYTVRWEREAAEVQQRSVQARQIWFTRQLRSNGKSRQQDEQPGPDRSPLKRLVDALASTGSLGCP